MHVFHDRTKYDFGTYSTEYRGFCGFAEVFVARLKSSKKRQNLQYPAEYVSNLYFVQWKTYVPQ